MKKYIILTGNIYNMGGAQMYTSNKCAFLKSRGWDVQVFHFSNEGKLMLPNLEPYVNNYIPELQYGFYYWSGKERTRILDFLCASIEPSDDVVVESQLMELTYWGELIAQRVKAKSILNCLEEHISQVNEREAAFLEYKVKRYEVLNGSSTSYQRYFGKLYKSEFDEYSNEGMMPICSNVVSDECNDIDIPKADFTILSLGRLDKPYIQTMLLGVHKFVTTNQDYTYNFIVIGGSPDGTIEQQIEALFGGLSNVNLCLLGYMYPIPLSLIKTIDVSMATANSVLVTADYGIPTIVYDISDFQTIGIYGHTTKSCFKRSCEISVPTESLLYDILLNRNINRHNYNNKRDIDAIFDSQLAFLLKSPNDGLTYDVMRIHGFMKIFISRIKKDILIICNKFKHSVI